MAQSYPTQSTCSQVDRSPWLTILRVTANLLFSRSSLCAGLGAAACFRLKGLEDVHSLVDDDGGFTAETRAAMRKRRGGLYDSLSAAGPASEERGAGGERSVSVGIAAGGGSGSGSGESDAKAPGRHVNPSEWPSVQPGGGRKNESRKTGSSRPG